VVVEPELLNPTVVYSETVNSCAAHVHGLGGWG
jgi:hypothetical protein